MNEDALLLIRDAIQRGVSRIDLVRAVTACARAVAHLAPNDTGTVFASVEAAERWTRKPTQNHAQAALVAEMACLELNTLKPNYQDVADSTEVLAILAVVWAAFACVVGQDLLELTIVFSVENASEAAEGLNIDLAVIVTSALL